VAVALPRGRVTHRYEVFIAAPPQTVWDTYFVHINKVDYRPGTKLIDVKIVREAPLTVRATVQHDIMSEPRTVVFIYDVYEPYSRYCLEQAGSDFMEEGEFIAEPGGTRLRVNITGKMRGFVLPWIARRRVRRNQQALKTVCEGHATPQPRAPLPRAARWEVWLAAALLAAVFLPLPWPVYVLLSIGFIWLAARYLRRFLLFARRL
jgi:hypothetical protein